MKTPCVPGEADRLLMSRSVFVCLCSFVCVNLINAVHQNCSANIQIHTYLYFHTYQVGRVGTSDINGSSSKQFFAGYIKRIPQTEIYVNFKRGNDTTGNGTALKPFATINPDRFASTYLKKKYLYFKIYRSDNSGVRVALVCRRLGDFSTTFPVDTTSFLRNLELIYSSGIPC